MVWIIAVKTLNKTVSADIFNLLTTQYVSN